MTYSEHELEFMFAKNVDLLYVEFEVAEPIACDVMKRCTKFQRNRATRGGVIGNNYVAGCSMRFQYLTL